MRHVLPLLLVIALLSAVAPPARTEAAPEFPVTVHERVLPNGMKILVLPRKGVPHVSCALTYHVGSVNERVGQTGMAHYLEHMMFKGTEKMGVKDLALDATYREALDRVLAETTHLEDLPASAERDARLAALEVERNRLIDEQKQNLEINPIFKIYGDAGSTFTNAMTSEDATTYIAALPPENVELFFWVEADRLQHCIFRQFHAEKDVVREERRMYENRPGALFDEAVQRALFGSHPYAHPVLGYHEDLRVMTRDELRSFFDTYYAPDNATLMVAGDVEPERIFDLAARYFGPIPASSKTRPRIPVLPIPRSGEIRMQARGKDRSAVDLYFRVPAGGTEDALALELLAMHLGDEEGALFEDLVEKDKLAVSLRVSYDARTYGGVLHVGARLAPGASPAAAEARIWKAVEALREAAPSDEAMASLRRRYRADVLGSVRSDMRLGFLILRSESTGSWRDIERDLQRVKALPAGAIRDLATAYLVRENALVTHYANDEEAGEPAPAASPLPTHLAAAPATPAIASGASAPTPASWKDIEYPERAFVLPRSEDARKVLKNGIRAFVVPNVGDPSIRVAAQVLGGSAEDPEGKEGLAELAASLLGEAGIPGLAPKALKEHLESLVASLDTGADVDAHGLTLSVFPADLAEGLRVLHLLLTEPVLDPSAFGRLKEAMLSRIDGEDARMRSVTSRLYRELIWGEVPETRRPTRASVESITLDDVRAYLAANTGPERIVLAVSGDFNAETMTARLDEALGAWTREGVAPYEPPSARASVDGAAKGLHVRPMAASQGSVRIGHPTVPATHEDAPALRVLASILARRTFNTIRSVHGLAYQASAQFDPSWRHDSPLTVLFQTKCESVPFAIDLAIRELERIRKEGPTAEEVEEAKRSMEAGFRRAFGRGSEAADRFAELEIHGVAPTHYESLRRAYAALDAEAVREAAARHVDPDRLLVMCVGDVEAMRDGDGQHAPTLADFGEMRVHDAPAKALAGSADAVARRILDALGQGDLATVKAHATDAMRKRLEEAPDLEARMGMFQRMLGTASVSDPEVEEASGKAQARVRIEATFGEQAMVLALRMDLVQEDGIWKCDAFQVNPAGS